MKLNELHESSYESRVRKYEKEGLTRSDAQGAVDAEDLKKSRQNDVVKVLPSRDLDNGEFAVTHNGKEVSWHPTKEAAVDAKTAYVRRLDIAKRKKMNEAEDEKEEDKDGPTKSVVVSYATHEFPIDKDLEEKINASCKSHGGKETDRTMSKTNVRSLTFELPSGKAGAFSKAAHSLISSKHFSKK